MCWCIDCNIVTTYELTSFSKATNILDTDLKHDRSALLLNLWYYETDMMIYCTIVNGENMADTICPMQLARAFVRWNRSYYVFQGCIKKVIISFVLWMWRSLESVRYGFRDIRSHWELAGTSIAIPPRCLSNLRATRTFRGFNTRSRSFETLQDLAKRRLAVYNDK